MENIYNSCDIYIFKLYEKKYDDEYYDESIDSYITDTYFKLKDFCLGIIKGEDTIFDIINEKNIKALNIKTIENTDFILLDECFHFNNCLIDAAKDIDMSLTVIKNIWNIIKEDIKKVMESNFEKLYFLQYPHLEKGYFPLKNSLIYSNDLEYVDEYKEYRKSRILVPKGINNKNIIM